MFTQKLIKQNFIRGLTENSQNKNDKKRKEKPIYY